MGTPAYTDTACGRSSELCVVDHALSRVPSAVHGKKTTTNDVLKIEKKKVCGIKKAPKLRQIGRVGVTS